MMLIQRVAKARPDHVSVDFRGRQIRVSEHGLDTAKIGAPFEKVRGKGMPKHVWRQVMENACPLYVTFDPRPKRLTGHAAAPRGDEQMLGRFAFEKRGAPPAEIFLNRLERRGVHRNDTLLVSFSRDANEPQTGVEGRLAQSRQLADPNAGRVE